LGWHPAAAP